MWRSGVELMHPPQHPVDLRRSFAHKGIAVIDESFDVVGQRVVRGHREVGFTCCGPSHGQRVDRIRLTAFTSGTAVFGHQARRYPHHFLSRAQQVAFQPSGHVAAVLDGPQHRGAKACVSPLHGFAVADGGGGHHGGPELLADSVDRDECVRALVHIGTDDDHGRCLPVSGVATVGPVGGHISVGGRCHAPIKSRRPVLTHQESAQ